MRDIRKIIEDAIEICSKAVAQPTMGPSDTADYASAVHDMTVSYVLLFGTDRQQNDPNAWPQPPKADPTPEKDQ